ncbi:MAG: hypothetical protein U9Q05_04930, partial [Thermodesulfobacteriota bacterium]|nr:hypothetical protein [Thermodesulfobacteriota bacterium]
MMKSAIIEKIAKTRFVRKAIEDRADLSAFRQKPTPRILLGVFLIAFSYVIAWPAIGALGILSVYMEKPLILIIGGPLTYVLSHLVFLLGMVLAGADYTIIFLRWAARVTVEKYIPPGKSTESG